MKCKLIRISFKNPFKHSSYKRSINANYECLLRYDNLICSSQLKDLLVKMTQRNPKNRISATAARNHKALLQIIYKTDNMNSVTQTKIKHLVNSNVIRQSDKTSGCLVLNNVSAEYGLDHKENANINTTQNIRTINKICTNFEYQTPLNGSTATLTKIKTYKYSTNKLDGSIATIKNEIAKYRRINFECSKTNPTEVKTARVNYNTTLNKDSYGYTSALAKLRTLKNGSITYR